MKDLHTPTDIQTITDMLDKILIDYYVSPDKDPVLRYATPEEVAASLKQEHPPKEGLGLAAALKLFMDKVLHHSVKTWHPTFFNQMSAGASFLAVLGDTLSSMINGTLSTFEASPAATVVERTVSRWMAGLLGMKPGSEGIFLPGSSLANFLALVIARNTRLNPEMASKGLQGIPEQGAVLCSQASHYSVSNAVNLLGLGSDRLFKVETNSRNEMIAENVVEQLERARSQGLKPFAIVVTLGVTVTGGFDPLAKIVEICRNEDIHIHVDAAFGGGLALTSRGPEFMAGIEEADTVTWDAHKWLHAPLTCSVLLSPRPEVMKQTFNSKAPYLFHHADEDGGISEDLGHYTVLCGKRFHALSVWLMFQSYGEQFMRDEAEGRLQFTYELADYLDKDPDFNLAYQPISPVMCFRYLPQALEGKPLDAVNRLQRRLREEVRSRGLALFNITDIKGISYFRLILINPLTTMDDMRPLIEHIREFGQAFEKDL